MISALLEPKPGLINLAADVFHFRARLAPSAEDRFNTRFEILYACIVARLRSRFQPPRWLRGVR